MGFEYPCFTPSHLNLGYILKSGKTQIWNSNLVNSVFFVPNYSTLKIAIRFCTCSTQWDDVKESFINGHVKEFFLNKWNLKLWYYNVNFGCIMQLKTNRYPIWAKAQQVRWRYIWLIFFKKIVVRNFFINSSDINNHF
jgi:hypothetical protein